MENKSLFLLAYDIITTKEREGSMKTHRMILLISLIVSVISLIVVIVVSQDSKVFQIFLGLMGSAIVAGLLEIPNYISLREENENRLYYSLYNIKSQLMIIWNTINSLKEKNSVIVEKICDYPIQIISVNMNNLYIFDNNYYLRKSKRKEYLNSISSIFNEYDKLINLYNYFSVHYYEHMIVIVEKEGNKRNIIANEMIDDLNDILKKSIFLNDIIDAGVERILPKKLRIKWEEDEKILLERNKPNL